MTFIFVSYSCICFYNRHFPVYLRELDDIMRGRQILVDLIERNALPVFKDINTALKCSAHVLQKVAKNTVKHLKKRGHLDPGDMVILIFLFYFQNVPVSELGKEQGAVPTKYGFLKVGELLL